VKPTNAASALGSVAFLISSECAPLALFPASLIGSDMFYAP